MSNQDFIDKAAIEAMKALITNSGLVAERILDPHYSGYVGLIAEASYKIAKAVISERQKNWQ